MYEGMFLLDSAKFHADPDAAAQHVVDILENAGAQVTVHRPWQDSKLAYEVEGHRKGVHYLTYFTMTGSGVDQINRPCKLSDTIIRHLVIAQPKKLFDAMVEALQGSQPAVFEDTEDEAADEAVAETKDEEKEEATETADAE